MTDKTQDVVEAAYREGFLDAHQGSARFEAEREADAYWNLSDAKAALASLFASPDRDDVRELLNNLPVRTRHYKYSDPMSGRPIWRNECGIWNGQQPKGSVDLYDRQTVEAALARIDAHLEGEA